MLRLRRLILTKWLRLKLFFTDKSERERKKMIKRAVSHNNRVTARGYGTYKSVVLFGRRF